MALLIPRATYATLPTELRLDIMEDVYKSIPLSSFFLLRHVSRAFRDVVAAVMEKYKFAAMLVTSISDEPFPEDTADRHATVEELRSPSGANVCYVKTTRSKLSLHHSLFSAAPLPIASMTPENVPFKIRQKSMTGLYFPSDTIGNAKTLKVTSFFDSPMTTRGLTKVIIDTGIITCGPHIPPHITENSDHNFVVVNRDTLGAPARVSDFWSALQSWAEAEGQREWISQYHAEFHGLKWLKQNIFRLTGHPRVEKRIDELLKELMLNEDEDSSEEEDESNGGEEESSDGGGSEEYESGEGESSEEDVEDGQDDAETAESDERVETGQGGR